MDLEKICLEVCELAKETGSFIRNEARKFSTDMVEVKGSNNFVSYVDKTSEKKIIEGLSKLLPGSGFIAEEETTKESEAVFQWIIDPLDGTTNFIHGLPPYAISIALMEGKDIVLGVVYEIFASECFYAWKDSKAYLNGKEIQVSKSAKISDSLIATGFPYYDYSLVKPFLDSLNYFFVNSHGVRRIGSAATDIAYVACGRFDAFYEYGLHAWDVAAGSIILKQAGGKVSDFKGGENCIFGSEYIASNSNIYSEFLEIVNKFLSR